MENGNSNSVIISTIENPWSDNSVQYVEEGTLEIEKENSNMGNQDFKNLDDYLRNKKERLGNDLDGWMRGTFKNYANVMEELEKEAKVNSETINEVANESINNETVNENEANFYSSEADKLAAENQALYF